MSENCLPLLYRRALCVVLALWAVCVQSAEQCTAVFPGGIQSHSPSGFIQMGYMSRVYGSGPTLNAPTVNHTHTWADQYGLCDGVICSATGNHTSTVNVDFQAGSDVPTTFQLSTSDNNIANGYQSGTLSLSAGDYGTVSVGQASTIRFATANSIYKVKTISTAYQSTVEFQPGTYWVNGNLDWQAQDTRIRRLSGNDGMVTLYVSGNVNIGQAQIEGFSEGQVRLYVQGNVTVGNNFVFPGEIHARGQVSLGMNAVVTGGIYSGNFSTGNTATIRYTRANYDHKMGTLNPAYNSTFELSPGNYWIDGGFTANVASKFRKIGGNGVVRIFVRGDINVQHDASFEGFSGGDLVMYSTGNITLTSQTDLPAFVYAAGDVTINFSNNARYKGGITGRNVYIGQGSIVEYLDPVDLGPLCDDEPSVIAVDHYSLDYSATALTCEPVPVKVSAYDSQGNLSSVSATVTLSPAGAWQGSGTLTFVGQGTAYMKRLPGVYTLGIASADPQAINATLCSTANCQITLRDSGFIFKDLSPMIAGKEQAAHIQAVRKDETTEACVPGFASGGARQISFSASYENPTSGTMAPVVAGTTLIPGEPAQSISLTFGSDASASLPVTYMDAGRIKLTARYEGSASSEDEGLVMTGEDSFVSRPYGFCIKPPQEAPISIDEEIIDFDSLVRFKAGDSFSVSVRAIRWDGNGEVYGSTDEPLLAENICDNDPTPNYRQNESTNFEGIPKLIQPVGGMAGTASGSFKHQDDQVINGTVSANVTLNEVGFFRIQTETPPAYLDADMSDSISQSAVIGRIIPAWLEVESTLIQQFGCAASAFTYQDQPTRLSGGLEVKGFGRGGNQTLNYRDDFWRVGTDQVYGLYRSDSAPVEDEESHVTPRPALELDPTNARLQFNDDYHYPRQATPSAADAPFGLKWIVWDLHDDDKVYFSNRQGEESDWGEKTVGVLVSGLIQDSQFRLGRVRSENIRIPLGNSAQAPIMLEHWSGAAWQSATDSCTTLTEPIDTPEQLSFPDPGVTAATLDAADWDQSLLQVTATAPSSPHGSVLLRHLLLDKDNDANATWLCRQRSEANAPLGGVCSHGEGEIAETRSSITFGIYQGPEPLIFRREVYR
ncbi:DUF6701 domain-containing protein [Pseudomonas lopnurensis]|uniref:DUF6701 domain-containing protein n=1 Tax=Pseudomonas lopnurensis TaxID=1477517 RepID=UPI0018798AAD|nr:DUF6701 domain-containing protein [Pseudomonas lopnurensis]MBE7374790.1 hypothetical protein [Pseudomonas lopnurensis]